MKGKYTFWMFLGPAVVLITFITFVPLLYNVGVSVYDYNLISGTKRFIGIGNFSTIFKDWRVLNSVQITLRFIAFVVPVELVLGFALAVLFDRNMWGVGFLRTLMCLPMVVSPVAIGLCWRLIFEPSYGLLNYSLSLFGVKLINWLGSANLALWACALVDIWQWTPFMFLILLAGLRSLPREPLEAAEVDGAGGWSKFVKITVPLLRPTILIAVLFRLVDAIRIYDIIVVLTHGGPGLSTDVFSYYIYRVGFKYFNLGYAAALSFLFLALGGILISIYLILGKLRLW